MNDSDIRSLIEQIVEGRGDDSFVYHCCGQEYVGAESLAAHMKACHAEEYVEKIKYLLRTSRVRLPSSGTIHAAVNRHKRKIEKEAKAKANRRSRRRIEPEGNGQRPIYTPMGNKR